MREERDKSAPSDETDTKTYLTSEEKKKGGAQEVIATAGQTTFFQWEGATLIGVEMAPGCDVLLVLLGMVAAEKIKEEKSQGQAGGA